MNAADSRLITAYWLVGGVAFVAALVAHKVWADRRQKRALAEYARLRAERAERYRAAEEALAIRNARRRGRPCPTNDQLQAVLAKALELHRDVAVAKFAAEMDELTKKGEL